MATKKSKFDFKSAAFPLIMTVLAFMCFVPIFLSFTVESIYPHYFLSSLFVIPALIFGAIAFLTGKGWFKVTLSNIITGILVPVLAVSGFFGVFWMSMDLGVSQSTTDVSRYERVLRVRTNNSNRALFEKFPRSIPATASDVYFNYNYGAWLDMHEVLVLRFAESSETIAGYIANFSTKAEWSGSADSWRTQGKDRFTGDNAGGRFVGYDDRFVGTVNIGGLPDDFVVYLLYGSGAGRMSVVSISTERNQIIFFAQRWSM